MPALDPAFVALLLGACFVGFVITSAVGLGSAIFLVPLFMFRLPAAQAVSLAAPITLVGNLSRAWLLREHVDRRAAWLVMVGSVPAAFVSAGFVIDVDARLLKLAVGLLVLSSLALDAFKPDALRVGAFGLSVAGTLAGVLSGLSGLAGPPGVIALRAYGLTGPSFVATLSVWGVALQATKIPAYVASGALPFAVAGLGAVLCLLSILGAFVATRWLSTLDARVFRALLNGVLCVVALVLIADALRG